MVTQYQEANKKIDKLINNLANERKKFKNKNHAKDQSIYYFKKELEKLRKENNKKTGHLELFK